jgi:hypothetical protein
LRGFFGLADALLDFGLKILAEAFGDDARRREFAEVGDGEFGKIGEDGRERGAGMADEREADVIALRPLAVVRDRLDYADGEAVEREGFQDLGFVEIGIVEDNGENLRMTLGEESAGYASRAAAGECELLSERELREARD